MTGTICINLGSQRRASRGDASEAQVLFGVVNEAVERLGVGHCIVVEGPQPPDGEVPLPARRVSPIPLASKTIGWSAASAELGDKSSNEAFGDERRFGGGLFGTPEVKNAGKRRPDRGLEPGVPQLSNPAHPMQMYRDPASLRSVQCAADLLR